MIYAAILVALLVPVALHSAIDTETSVDSVVAGNMSNHDSQQRIAGNGHDQGSSEGVQT